MTKDEPRNASEAGLSSRGEQSEVLRALGRWLDEQGAQGVRITNYDTFLSVTWDQAMGEATHRAYHENEIAHLRAEARMLRRGAVGAPKGTLAELLRTLGQELDEAGLQADGIVEEDGGFRVSGSSNGMYFSQFFESALLQQSSARRRWSRGRYTGPAASDRVLEVMLGLPLYTQDEQRLGMVAEVRAEQIRVHTGMLRRDYWLPVGCIGTLIPGKRAVVGFVKRELTSQKQPGFASVS